MEEKCENCKKSKKANKPDYQPKGDVHQVYCDEKGMNVPNYFWCEDGELDK